MEEGQRHWYVIHTYSGYENKVKKNLENKIHSLEFEDKIFQVLVPMQNEVDARDDQQKIVARKVFPGYVLIDMIVDERTWYAVRNTPGVTGFVGGLGNTGSNSIKPTPLSDDEVARILKAQPKEEGAETKEEAPVHVECPVSLNDSVRIKAPGFTDMVGTVSEINEEQQKVKVMIEMFGRVTPIEVNFTQVEAIE